jgi:flagellar protein FliS
MALNVYEENRILSASRVELVRILYSAAARAVGDARECLRAGDIAARSRAITRAQMALLELAGSVDRGKGEISERLLALYDYMLGRLTQANLQQEEAPLAEVGRLLGTLQEGWSSVVDEPEAALAAR